MNIVGSHPHHQNKAANQVAKAESIYIVNWDFYWLYDYMTCIHAATNWITALWIELELNWVIRYLAIPTPSVATDLSYSWHHKELISSNRIVLSLTGWKHINNSVGRLDFANVLETDQEGKKKKSTFGLSTYLPLTAEVFAL